MTVLTSDPTRRAGWVMSDPARSQLEECGIDRAEVYRVLTEPQMVIPAPRGGQRFNGYGLSVIVDDGVIVAVQIDGATRGNWDGWARERAEFADADLTAADALVRSELQRQPASQVPEPRRRRRPVAAPIVTTHLIDRVHPRLRAEVTRLVAGDWSRMVVHSPCRVEILPAT